ncbi:hypothetical protein [Campylobacter sputorum]|uniref:hypothetical protein n=1 Tax=Campylobacter sputorum TaxID=206 RepID=UPI000B77D31C|nr:hypothetical protein [Campylobacter sputorum]ASM36177.1 hypothetical protein CSF_0258 [Campylobacter sputorum bv. faecalis CCUG 20703]
MQGYAYTRDNNGTKEVVVFDKNIGKNICNNSSYNGFFIKSNQIAKIIQDLNAFAKDNGIANITNS